MWITLKPEKSYVFPQNQVFIGLDIPEGHQPTLEREECFFKYLFIEIHETVEGLKAAKM